jgi:hypothetical protein
MLERVARILHHHNGFLFIICSNVKARRQLIRALKGLPVTFLPAPCGIHATSLGQLEDFFASPLTIPPVYVYNVDAAEHQPSSYTCQVE